MKYFLIIPILLFLCSCNEKINSDNIIQEIPELTSNLSIAEIAKLDSLNINFQLRGDCYAYSSNKNAQNSNGEAHSKNLPKKVNNKFPRKGLYLLINENEKIKIDSTILGFKLYLVNTTNSLVELDASDSRLNIIAEALNKNKKWTPITYLPSSWCGNSYHTVKLDKNEYWSFDIPVFKGTIKTKLRYTLKLNKGKKISSNEIVTYLNTDQFDETKKQGYKSNDLMDPYIE